jgi:hypothetical protein
MSTSRASNPGGLPSVCAPPRPLGMFSRSARSRPVRHEPGRCGGCSRSRWRAAAWTTATRPRPGARRRPRISRAPHADVSQTCPTTGAPSVRDASEQRKRRPMRRLSEEPSAGLEPATPSLPWRSRHRGDSALEGQSRCTAALREIAAGRSDRHGSTPLVPTGYPMSDGVPPLARHDERGLKSPTAGTTTRLQVHLRCRDSIAAPSAGARSLSARSTSSTTEGRAGALAVQPLEPRVNPADELCDPLEVVALGAVEQTV